MNTDQQHGRRWRVRAMTLIFLSVGVLSWAVPTVQGVNQDPLAGLTGVAKGSGLDKVKDVPTGIGNIIGTITALVGVLFFLLAIYGGILWMTARGNDDQVRKAFGILVSAAVGMIVVVGSAVIVSFIFDTAGGGESPAGAGTTKGGPLPGGVPTETFPSSCPIGDNSACGPRGVCDGDTGSGEGLCIDKCDNERGGEGYSCNDTSLCDSATIVRGLCRGGAARVCCRPK